MPARKRTATERATTMKPRMQLLPAGDPAPGTRYNTGRSPQTQREYDSEALQLSDPSGLPPRPALVVRKSHASSACCGTLLPQVPLHDQGGRVRGAGVRRLDRTRAKSAPLCAALEPSHLDPDRQLPVVRLRRAAWSRSLPRGLVADQAAAAIKRAGEAPRLHELRRARVNRDNVRTAPNRTPIALGRYTLVPLQLQSTIAPLSRAALCPSSTRTVKV